MSQSHNPADTQGLLQSMLQRLRLQPGSPGPIPAASNLHANDLELGTNGIASDKFGISAVDDLVIKGGGRHREGDGYGMDRSLVSSPSQKESSDKETGENRVLGEATLPQITPVRTGQLFPAKSLKGADITSCDETDGKRGTFSSLGEQDPALLNSGQDNQSVENVQGFTPKVYMWSVTPADANVDTGSEEGKALHVGNGGFGASAHSKNTQFVATNSNSRRKQRPSENKTRRWTQKLKERWLDRQGSGKKEKENGRRVGLNSEQGTEISPERQPQPAEGRITTSHKEEEGTWVSFDSCDARPLPPQDDSSRFRPSSDFEFGLGSFSLLEEIVTGQEWAKFLNPNPPAASANQRPPEEPLSQMESLPSRYDFAPSSQTLSQRGGRRHLWSFGGPESHRGPEFSMAQVSSDGYSLPVSMDVTEGRQYGDGAADLSEPMEESQPGERRPRQQWRSPSCTERADILDNPTLKKILLNRKRQYQSADRDQRVAPDEAGTSASSVTNSHVMFDTVALQHDVLMPLNPLNPPPAPLSPLRPFAPEPRGVLKKSTPFDSDPSMETVTKRRRVEENRRVRFAEEVITIAPPEPGAYGSESEEDSGAEDDSVIEQECEVEPVETGEAAAAAAAVVAASAAAARRSTLPAWIQALKRRNTGRKHRL